MRALAAQETRWWAGAAAALAILAAAGCGPAPGPGGGTSGAQYARAYQPDGTARIAAGQPLTIELGDMFFRPNTLTAMHGVHVELRLHNGSPITHNFTLRGLGVSQNVGPQQTATVNFPAPAPGSYYFYCDVPGHAAAGMVGRLVVQ